MTPGATWPGCSRWSSKGTISGSMAKDVFEKMFASGRTADEIVAAEGLAQIDDESQIVALIAEVLAAQSPVRSPSTAAARRAPSASSSAR